MIYNNIGLSLSIGVGESCNIYFLFTILVGSTHGAYNKKHICTLKSHAASLICLGGL